MSTDKWSKGFRVVANNNKETLNTNGHEIWSSLHTHSDASHDGITPLSELVKTAASLKFRHLALTEHGTLMSSISLTQECKRYGIKPVHGNEIYLEHNDSIFHLTLLADGNKGYDSLVELNNIGKRSDHRRGPITIPDLIRHNEGIVVLSGCPASPMQVLEWPEALKVATQLKSTFGSRLFSEIMFTTTSSPSGSWERSIRLANALGLHLVFTNDVHFPRKEHHKIHMLYQDMKSLGRFKYESGGLFLATSDELRRRVNKIDPALLHYLEVGMANSFILAEKIDEVVFDATPKLPHIPDAEKQLEDFVWDAFSNYSRQSDETADRIRYELGIIITKGYATYFLIVKDIIDNARASGVVIGPGRGSAVGSLVAYLLGITQVDPIEYGLQFERFLNPNRSAMPDIDTDIAASQRSILLEFANKKYDAVPIITVSRNTEKSLIRDLCRHFKSTRSEEDKAADAGYDSPEFNAVARKNKNMREAYQTMYGQIRHKGKHAGGIVIAKDIKIPYEKTADEEFAAAWTEGSKAELSKAGIIKLDFLGLSALDILRDLKESTGISPPEPTENAPEFELVRQGKTLGVFQLTGSDGIRDYGMKVQPTCIQDIIALTSLWRTGPIQAKAHDYYLKARHGKPRKVHPEVDEILKETFGLIVYQEDFMRLYAWATGRDLGDADNARRVIVKFKPNDPKSVLDLANLEDEFKTGCTNHGLTTKKANKLWGEIVTHTGYSFNKSHATAYSMISWKMLWYKYHHPAEYYTSLLNHDPDRQQEYIFDVVAEGFEIVQPDVNKSAMKYTTDGKHIYVPFTAIKHLGPNGAQEIVDNVPYVSPEDFMMKVEKRKVPKRGRVGLLQLGAFRSIGGEAKDYDIDPADMLCIAKPAAFKKFLKSEKIDEHLLVKLLLGTITDEEFKELYKITKPLGKKTFLQLLVELSEQIGEHSHYLQDMFGILISEGKLKTIMMELTGFLMVDEDDIRSQYLGVAVPSPKRVKRINDFLAQGSNKSAGIVLDIEKRKSTYNPVYYRIQLYPGRSVWSPQLDGIREGQWILCDMSEQTGKMLRCVKI